MNVIRISFAYTLIGETIPRRYSEDWPQMDVEDLEKIQRNCSSHGKIVVYRGRSHSDCSMEQIDWITDLLQLIKVQSLQMSGRARKLHDHKQLMRDLENDAGT